MYRKVSLSSFHNGKVEYCAIFGSGDIEENASVIFFYSDFMYIQSKSVSIGKNSRVLYIIFTIDARVPCKT